MIIRLTCWGLGDALQKSFRGKKIEKNSMKLL